MLTGLKQPRGGRGNFHRGGRGGGGTRSNVRQDRSDIDRHHVKYEAYYDALSLIPEDERELFWDALRRDLPNSFRFTGSKSYVKPVTCRVFQY